MKRLAAVFIAAALLTSGAALAAKLDWFQFNYGSYFNGAWDYSVYEYNGDYYLDAQGLNGVNMNVSKKKLSKGDVDELTGIIKSCKLNSWDGFDESEAASDGVDGFTIDISYKNGTVISATGYGEYPDGYWDAWAELTGFFDTVTGGSSSSDYAQDEYDDDYNDEYDDYSDDYDDYDDEEY